MSGGSTRASMPGRPGPRAATGLVAITAASSRARPRCHGRSRKLCRAGSWLPGGRPACRMFLMAVSPDQGQTSRREDTQGFWVTVVEIALPPRLERTVTCVGGRKLAMPLPLPAGFKMYPGPISCQQGSLVGHVPGTAGELPTRAISARMGVDWLPGMPAGRVSLNISTCMNMPGGGGVTEEVAVMLIFPLLALLIHATFRIVTTSPGTAGNFRAALTAGASTHRL